MNAKLSSKNQIVIPKEARAILHLKPGDEMLLIPKGNIVLLTKASQSESDRLKGILEPKAAARLKKQIKRDRLDW